MVSFFFFIKIRFLDEVGAIVVDIGSHTTRAGYAGEDMPKVTKLKSIFFYSKSNKKTIMQKIHKSKDPKIRFKLNQQVFCN